MLKNTVFVGGVMAMMVALAGSAEAGTLTRRIIRDNGASLSGSSLTIQGVTVTTNQFGGYEVQLPDGEYELAVTVDGQPYRTDPIRIYSPQTKQNWRLNPNAKRLEKIFSERGAAMADNQRDWIDILAKLLPGLSALLAGILVPLVIHVNGERSRQNQLYAEIVSKREAADSDLRAKMFQNLITAFYGDQADDPRNKVSLLRLLALNFHEFFDLKPLFEDLQTNLNAEERKRFQSFLRELAGKQEAMLLHGPGVQFFRLHLGEGMANGMTVPENNASYQGHRLGVTATEINAQEEYVLMQVVDLPDTTEKRAGTLAEVRFKLTYGSLPFIDNTKLFGGTRFAVTLEQFNEGTPKSADIKIIFFPESYMSSRDRPYMDEMINQLHDNIQRK